MKLTTKVILVNTAILTLAVAITSSFIFAGIRAEMERQANASQERILKSFWRLLKSNDGEFRVVGGKLMTGNTVLNGNHALPDAVKETFGGTATIFLGDTRIATNVLKPDGSRAVGTKLTGPALDTVIKEGKPYRGEAEILDVPYLTAYDPIRNDKGEVIGALYVGVRKSDYFAAYSGLGGGVAAMTLAIALLFSLVTWLFVRRTLAPIIGEVSGITDRIHCHAGTIAMTIDQQSGFATELSSSVMEISATMEEFTSTAIQIAQHSHSVVERADRTLEDSKNGAAEVENLTFKVNDISDNIQANLGEIVELGRRSKEINKVMEIINNIANQTKLIAFNAALEAASAGEAGKRFGVVAVEIRRLADSVVESTAEIEGKITEILDSVHRLVMSSEKSAQLIQEGQEYASHTMTMLIESVDGVEETADAARQISLSTQQQQIASSQVLVALKEIEQGVRFASSSTHEANSVTVELAGLSERLRGVVRSLSGAPGGEAPAPGGGN